MSDIQPYREAVSSIKQAILHSQYRAAKLITGEQLSLYFGIGGYISHHSRKGFWGTGALERISEQLSKELPGLRGFSTTSLKNMRTFFEFWAPFINRQPTADDVDERVVEQAIVRNIKKFIMTFGRDFAFIGNQYHLEVYGEELFPDLLFFNRELNCMVVVELKKGAFKPGYIGQLQTYMRVLDDKVRKPHENPTIGILLCKSANKAFVEYVIRDYNSPMGVATYKTAADMDTKLRNSLPDMEEMRKLLIESTDNE